MENALDLTQKISDLEAKNHLLRQENDFLREQFNLARHRQFDASSEKASIQPSLFNEAEVECEAQEVASEMVVEEAKSENASEQAPKKAQPKRKPLPKHLPRETRVVDIPEAEKVCPCCNGTLHQCGQETSEQLEYIPASVKVIETLRP